MAPGRVRALQTDGGGERGNEAGADSCKEREIRLQFRQGGDRPCSLGRRNGLAGGMYNRLAVDGRFLYRAIINEERFRPNAMMSHGGFSAYWMVFGSNPEDSYLGRDEDSDLDFAQDTSASGQFAQLWKLRTSAQEATLTEIRNGKSRPPLARIKTFGCKDVQVGDSAGLRQQIGRKSAPKWRGLAVALDVGGARVAVKFRSQTLKVARYRVRKRQDPTDSVNAEWGPASGVGGEEDARPFLAGDKGP